MSIEFYMVIGMVAFAVAFRLWWRAVDRRHAREAAAQAAREHLRDYHARSDWDDVTRPRTRHEKEVDRIWRTGALRPNQPCQKAPHRQPNGLRTSDADQDYPIYGPAMKSYADAQGLELPSAPPISSGGGGDFGGGGASASYDDSGASSCGSSSSSSCSSGD